MQYSKRGQLTLMGSEHSIRCNFGILWLFEKSMYQIKRNNEFYIEI